MTDWKYWEEVKETFNEHKMIIRISREIIMKDINRNIADKVEKKCKVN